MARRTSAPDAGERDRAVTIQQLSSSTGTSKFPVETWTTLATPYWCTKQDVGGRERMAADQRSAPYTTRFEGGYRADVDPDLVDVRKTRRLLYQGRIYDIVDASMIGRKEGVEFLTLAKG